MVLGSSTLEDLEDADTPATIAEIADGLADNAVTPQTPPVTSPSYNAGDSWAAGWGQLLRIARQIAGLSLTELSAVTGLSKSYLSKLESSASGAANPSRATLAALARALPSFRPLAHTLEPGGGTAGLDYGATVPPARELPSDGAHATQITRSISLGWREMEVFAALFALEASAVPLRLTAPILARATGREVATTMRAMDHLIREHIVEVDLPARVGDVAAYRCADDGPARLGITRLGDLLVLAAALLAGTSVREATPHAGRAHIRGVVAKATDSALDQAPRTHEERGREDEANE